MIWLAWSVAAFLVGSIPFGIWIARRRGVDIRKHGSGNIGATNVLRVLGPRAGFTCLALDALKGLAPTAACGLVMHPRGPGETGLWLAVMASPILGHMFSPWVGFKGGKGVATGLGATLGVGPYLTLAAIGATIVFVLVAWRTRYVGLSSCVAAISLPAWTWAATRLARVTLHADLPPEAWAERMRAVTPIYLATAGIAALVVYKHRGNLRRVLAGTESRLSLARKKPDA